MTPEERQLLIQTHRMVAENTALLRKMHRAALWGRAWSVLYWGVIIGLSISAYLYVQPYVDTVKDGIVGFQSDLNNVKGVASKMGNFTNLFQSGTK